MKLFDDPSAGAIPPLFKYVPLANDEQIEWARQIVQAESIWFSSPDQFNDPQESHFNVSFDGTLYQIRELYRKIVEQERPECQAEEVDTYVASMLNEPRLRAELDVLVRRSIRNKIRSDHAMLCLGTTNDNYLMWSHYADRHRGICMEFDLENHREWRRRTRRVHYSRDLPEFNWFDTSDEAKWIATLLTKHECWAYENEWRVIDLASGQGLRKLESGMVKSVTLGAETAPDREKLVRGWLRDTSIQLKGAFHHWCSYGLSIANDPPVHDSLAA